PFLGAGLPVIRSLDLYPQGEEFLLQADGLGVLVRRFEILDLLAPVGGFLGLVAAQESPPRRLRVIVPLRPVRTAQRPNESGQDGGDQGPAVREAPPALLWRGGCSVGAAELDDGRPVGEVGRWACIAGD